MSFHAPNQFRYRGPGPLTSADSYGNNGAFLLPHPNPASSISIRAICSDGEGWEHVSVTLSVQRCPTWEEMCFVKALFWDDCDCVVQFHPPKSEYVNCHPYCLHLWRPTDFSIRTPPSLMVGPK